LTLLFSACLAVAVGSTAPPSAAADAVTKLFVPRVPLYPGDVISIDVLVQREFAVTTTTADLSFGSTLDDLVGKVARRTLLPFRPVPASAIKEKDIVKQGRTYKLYYSSSVLTVTGVGVPLQSAAVGEEVNVRNSESGTTIKAMVQADGTLAVHDR
jgi:flagella basal body P-ring formation protein FlgA